MWLNFSFQRITFLLLFSHNKLLTKNNPIKRGILGPSRCPLYLNTKETPFYILEFQTSILILKLILRNTRIPVAIRPSTRENCFPESAQWLQQSHPSFWGWWYPGKYRFPDITKYLEIRDLTKKTFNMSYQSDKKSNVLICLN